MTQATEIYSYVNMILLSILGGAFVVFLGLGSWWAKDVHKKLQDAVTAADSMEQWARAHDKQDDSRHDENKERLDRNHTAVHELRTQLSDFAMRIRTTQRLDR